MGVVLLGNNGYTREGYEEILRNCINGPLFPLSKIFIYTKDLYSYYYEAIYSIIRLFVFMIKLRILVHYGGRYDRKHL